MKNKERKNLNKVNGKYYHLYGFMYQKLHVLSMEVMDKDSCCLDIYLWDEKKKEFGIYLFAIRNYTSFKNLDIVCHEQYFRKPVFIETWDGVGASCSPLYMNRVYTLPKFTGITNEDILNCTKHFCRSVLDNYWIWNIRMGTEKIDRDQLTFDWEKKCK